MVNLTLKNAFARRNHKERAQPLHRQRLGLLEKHKDYVHRARDYKSKQERIRKLREKAAFKNKDEFYWGMIKGKTKDGVALGDRGNEALSTDIVKLLKTQDVGYVRLQIAKDVKQVAKLRQELEITAPASGSSSEWTAASELAEVERLAEMGIVVNPQGNSSSRKGKGKARASLARHVVFAEGREDFDGFEHGTTEPVQENAEPDQPIDMGWIDEQANVKLKQKRAPSRDDPETAEESEEALRSQRLNLLTNLSAHLARIRLLRQAETRLETTKNLMGKGAPRKVREAGWVEDENQPEDRNGERKRWEAKAYKWKAERKR